MATSSITLSELEYGAAKSRRPEQNREALSAFVTPLEIVPYGMLKVRKVQHHCQPYGR
ncbi:MAG: type II toxin-antitoxin system VapC family toxin [Deltaproteobacteria bacterium]|nr:type II toxin-antitoxin system VapC family toxin [Deltaproteobacteria bacterium]MBW2167705.1 type II toxin-antitoxin system VapC family toxin [Deltaproteobacteria bacterium]